MKFYSTSHVNTFLSITNDRGDDCHSEKASRIKKKTFFSIFVIFHHFWGQSCVLFGFFVSSRALLLQNASLLTPLYLGKNYVYRKRIVKHISKLHFSTPKNVNISLTENLQLEAGGKPSTWFPPGGLVEQYLPRKRQANLLALPAFLPCLS